MDAEKSLSMQTSGASKVSSVAKQSLFHLRGQASVLEVKKAGFSVKIKGGEKTILHEISLIVNGGELLALMGPSGAGKTTLLELMSLNCTLGAPTGSVTLEKEPLTFKTFQEQAAFVEQYDSHWAFLTCKEIMDYTAELYLALSKEKRGEQVNDIMEHLGLMECKDTKAGNVFLKGISGGQKKRLSLGMALLKSPPLLFLDEPTSGLDAAATKSVVAYLQKITIEAGLISVATIHQPSADVFMSFTKVMFLANGRVAYWGTPREVDKYCNDIGYALPAFTNPADHFIQLINSEFVDRDQVDQIVSAWGSKPCGEVYEASIQKLPIVSRPNVLSQSWTLFRRSAVLSVRDPTLYVGRMLTFVIANCFFALVYIKAREREQEYAVARYFLILWFIAVPTMFNVVVVYACNEEFNLMRKEIKNGMSKTGAYLLSRTALELPFMIILALCAVGIPGYAIANFHADAFIPVVFVIALMLWCFECMAESLAVAFKNPLVGMLGAVGLWFVAFLFAGTFLDPDFIIWPLRACTFIFPLRWTAQTLVYLETHGTEWKGAELVSSAPGFLCPGKSPLQCYGRTGDQVRASLANLFGNVSEDDTRKHDVLILLAITVVWKLAYIAMVIYRSRKTLALRPAGSSVTTSSSDVVAPQIYPIAVLEEGDV